MTTPYEQRIMDLDRQIEEARPFYDMVRKRLGSEEYGLAVNTAIQRIVEIFKTPPGERPDLYALVQIGRIQEIVRPFEEDNAVLVKFSGLKDARQRLEKFS